MKKLVLAVSFAACAASPALAQSKTPMQNIEEGRRNERLDTDRQYEQQRRIRAVPDADVKVDPWAVVRGAEAPGGKQAAKKEPRKKPAAKPGTPMRVSQ